MNIFVSYCSDQESVAQEIVDWLEKNGCCCWISCRDCQADYMAEIIPAIRHSDAVLIVASESIKTSRHVRIEVGRAIKYGKDLIPLEVEDIDIDGAWTEYVWEAYQAISVKDQFAGTKLLNRLHIPCDNKTARTKHLEEDSDVKKEDAHTNGIENLIIGGAAVAGAALAAYLLSDD